ncbi:hypothetical protein [Tsukamurella spumae]|uniref:J domain-containing protein n=1 Tax=Tsukamurella spumae TaxID=44753 RepID=A0A846X5W4_9ACTN|nr:hypothetical protein [Tsukamurella spumae]NKY20461.1 hypothetical protein [Tsukamurella spumae]
MPHHIDLYAIYGLDRRQPPEALAAALTAALNATDPRDQLTRNRIDTARAILGDPARRARYDAALADPNAPTIDESALAAIAGRPVPAAVPKPGLAGAFAGRQVRILSAVTAALALVLVIGVTAVACSIGDSTPTATQQSGDRPSPSASAGPAASTDPLDEAYPASRRVAIGGTVTDLSGTITYRINGISRVTDPAPECPGEYFAVATTATTSDKMSGGRGNVYTVKPLDFVSADLTGQTNTASGRRDAQGHPLAATSADPPLTCTPGDPLQVSPSTSVPVTSYTRVAGLDNPVALSIGNGSKVVVLPENLR